MLALDFRCFKMVQKLPMGLLASFRATLEEMAEATVLLHVVDISHPNAPEHVEVVEGILAELDLTEKQRILALNKADLLDAEADASFSTDVAGATAVLTSAASGLGLVELLDAIGDAVASADLNLASLGA